MQKYVFLFCILCAEVCAQSFSSHKVAITPSLTPQIDFNEKAYATKLREKYKSEKKQEILERYIKEEQKGRRDFLESNQIYTNWEEAQLYIEQVFQKTVPAGFDKKEIRIVIIRDPDVNAYCMEDGLIAVTAGFLSWFKTEAYLASTLAHEYGHYKESHLFSDYKKTVKEMNKAVRTRVLGKDIGYSKLFQYKRDQESSADNYSFEFFNANAYNPSNIAEEFEEFKKITTRYEHLGYYRRWPAYLETHPSNDERMKSARNYFKNKNKGGKNFVVDSLVFEKVRKRATDETIYLLFEQLRYEECLEMAYLQYLYHPDDEFYLFFIAECLRRQMSYIPNYGDKNFITDNYKDLEPDKNTKSVKSVVLQETGMPVKSKLFSKAIAANLKGVIFCMSDEETEKVKAKELLFGHTLQFITNAQAYRYFNSRTSAQSPLFQLQKSLLASTSKPSETLGLSASDLEKEFFYNFSRYYDVQSDLNTFKNAPVLIKSIQVQAFNKTRASYFDSDEEEELLYESYDDFIKTYKSEYVDLNTKFNYKESYKLKNTINFISDLLEKNNFLGIPSSDFTIDFDYLKIFPELSPLMINHRYKKFILIELTVANPRGKENVLNPGEEREKWGVKFYCVDVANKKITRKNQIYGMFFPDGNRVNKFRKIMAVCETLLKEDQTSK